jgi:hypothetical protein
MWLEQYYSEDPEGIRFSRSQGSGFAKQVADDFNPLHDEKAKLFCVPGDLLCAFVLSRYGVCRQMRFIFKGMVGDGVALRCRQTSGSELRFEDAAGKTYLEVERNGECGTKPHVTEALTRCYVEFSGRNFPGVLVPLMADHGVMINPARPMVIYESMEFDIQQLDAQAPELELENATLEVKGKKGSVRLDFLLMDSGVPVGRGNKTMALRGLQPYDQARIGKLVENYLASKRSYVHPG